MCSFYKDSNHWGVFCVKQHLPRGVMNNKYPWCRCYQLKINLLKFSYWRPTSPVGAKRCKMAPIFQRFSRSTAIGGGNRKYLMKSVFSPISHRMNGCSTISRNDHMHVWWEFWRIIYWTFKPWTNWMVSDPTDSEICWLSHYCYIPTANLK